MRPDTYIEPPTKSELNGQEIRYCETCKEHPYQDEKNGDKYRIKHYSTSRKDWGCTVCGKYEKDVVKKSNKS